MANVILRHKTGAVGYSFGHGNKQFQSNESGHIAVPEELLGVAQDHGFELVRVAPEEQPVKEVAKIAATDGLEKAAAPELTGEGEGAEKAEGEEGE